MKLLHTYVMNYKRITVSLPNYLYTDLLTLVPTGGVSCYVADALEEKVLEEKLYKRKDPIKAFFDLRKMTTKLSDKEIMLAIRKGRM